MSDSLRALLVKCRAIDAVCAHYEEAVDVAVLRENAERYATSSWLLIEQSHSVQGEPSNLEEDSRLFEEAIDLQLTNFGDDVFVYDRWVHGSLQRRLHFDPYRGWITVEGTPEPWESSVFSSSPSVGTRKGMNATERILDAVVGHFGLPQLLLS